MGRVRETVAMPIYEYECNECQHQLEHLQKISEADLKDCPACGKSSLTRLISMPGFRLKGTGWYATDFKDKGKASTEATSQKAQTNSAADSSSSKKEEKSKSDTTSASNSNTTSSASTSTTETNK